jgi:hypothetical protein
MNWKKLAKILAYPFSLLGLSACQTAHTEVTIGARPATVWGVLTDAARYPEWNPVHVRIEGQYREGEEVKVHLREPGGKVNQFKSKVRRVVSERELNQGGGVPAFFTFNHTFLLEPVEGGTRVTQREEFRGIGLLFMDMSWAENSYKEVNLALKVRAEGIEAARKE